MLNDGHGKIYTQFYSTGILKPSIIDTNASYAGNWLAGFYNKTLKSHPRFLKDTLILITFDEVKLAKHS